ncbi:hypothetical protein PYCC9005_000433 [Savitreella phatthalungensis]
MKDAPQVQAARVTPLTCSGHTRPVTHLHFSGEVFISACKDGNPMLRDATTGDWIGTFIGHKGATWSAKLSQGTADKAVTGSADFSAKVWDTYSGQPTHSFSHNHIVRSVDFDGEANRVATGGQEKLVRIFDVRQGDTAVDEYAGHEGNIRSVVWQKGHGSEDRVLITADDRCIRYWDVRAGGKELHKWDTPNYPAQPITSLEQSRSFICVTAGKSVFFIDPQSREVTKQVDTDYDVSSVSLNPAMDKFVTGGSTELWVRVYDFATGTEQEVYKGHHGPIHTVEYSPDGGLYATGSEDGTIRLWKAVSGPYGLWN